MRPRATLVKSLLVIMSSAASSLLVPLASLAQIGDEALYKAAVVDYSAKNYEKARVELEAYIKVGVNRAEPLYYLGLTYQQLNRLPQAQKVYEVLLKNFPASAAAAPARVAIDQIKAALAPGPAILPKETWVPFVRQGNAMYVDGTVNGISQKMIFDTGAERCAFSLKNFKQLGIPLPTGAPSGMAAGVGKADGVPVWRVKVNLAVGHLERRNFSVMVGDMPLPAPLLGQDFLSGLEYSIDSSSNSISFKKKEDSGSVTLATAGVAGAAAAGMTVDASGKYVYTVPFTTDGECLVVDVLVNNKHLPMIFDTGAAICLFTAGQAREVGLVAGSGPAISINGVGGAALARVGSVDSIQLGPITRNNFRAPITDKIAAPKSLLGQDFVAGWHYSIDKQSKVIRFTKGY